MTTISLVLVLIIIATAMWLMPINEFIKKCLYVVAVGSVLLWILTVFGVIGRVGLSLP